MESVTIEAFEFDELSLSAKEEALSRLSEYIIRADHYTFFENGVPFEARGH